MKSTNKKFKLSILLLSLNFFVYSILFAQSTTYQISGYCYAYPYQVGQVDTPGYAYDLDLLGNYAYVADGSSGLRIIDISNPSSPNEISHLSSASTNYVSIVISGNYAYLAGGYGGLRIINISDPANPVEVGYSITSDYASGICVKDKYAYIAAGTTGLCIFDITNPTAPIEAGSNITQSPAVSVAVSGNYVYVSISGNFHYDYVDLVTHQTLHTYFTNAGIQIFNISNPTKPTLVDFLESDNPIQSNSATFDTYNPGSGLTIDQNILSFVESGTIEVYGYGYGGQWTYNNTYHPFTLYTYVITTTSSLQEIGNISYAIYGQTGTASVVGKYAYLCLGSSGFKIIDITKPMNFSELVNINTSGATKVKLDGKYAYLADGSGGIRVINVKQPQTNTTVTLSGDTNLVTSVDNTGYYQFSNIAYGYYSTWLSNHSSSPNYRTYSPLITNQTEQNFFLIENLTVPDTPGNLSAQPISNTQIQLNWQDYADNENGFGIDVKIGNGNWQVLTYVDSNVTTFTHSGLIPGQTYSYRIYAYNDLGLSGYSNVAYAIPGSPKAPVNLTATMPSSSQIRLIWQDNSNNESGFGIDYRINYGSWNTLDWVGSNVTTYLHSNLILGQTYSYRVFGWNNYGLSNYSNEVSITIQTPPTEIRQKVWMSFQ